MIGIESFELTGMSMCNLKLYLKTSVIKMNLFLKINVLSSIKVCYYFLVSNVIIFRNQVIYSILGLVDVWIVFRNQRDCPAKSIDSYDE